MMPQHSFEAERPIAQHCAELFTLEVSNEDRDAELAAFASAMERVFASSLAPGLGKGLAVTCGGAEALMPSALNKQIGKRAANFLLECGEEPMPLQLSLDFPSALLLTERAFGGDAKTKEMKVEALPPSCWLVLEQMSAQLAQVFAAAAELGGEARFVRRHENASRLSAFGKGEECLQWPVTITLDSKAAEPVEIALTIAVPAERFESAFTANVASANSTEEASAQSGAAAFLPLPICAVLANLSLPVARLANLKPGDCIPLAPNREVPLMVGDVAIARGAVGTLDERVALNLTQVS